MDNAKAGIFQFWAFVEFVVAGTSYSPRLEIYLFHRVFEFPCGRNDFSHEEIYFT